MARGELRGIGTLQPSPNFPNVWLMLSSRGRPSVGETGPASQRHSATGTKGSAACSSAHSAAPNSGGT